MNSIGLNGDYLLMKGSTMKLKNLQLSWLPSVALVACSKDVVNTPAVSRSRLCVRKMVQNQADLIGFGGAATRGWVAFVSCCWLQ